MTCVAAIPRVPHLLLSQIGHIYRYANSEIGGGVPEEVAV